MKPFKEVIDGIRKAIMASEVREDIAQMGEYVEQFANTAGENIQKAIDPTLSVSGKAADAAKVGQVKEDLELVGRDFRSDNLINRNTIMRNTFIEADGSVIADSDYNVTPFIDVSEYVEKRIYFIPNGNFGSGYQCRRLVAFDSSKNVVGTKDIWSYYDIPSNASYIRVCFNHAQAVAPLLTTRLDDKEYRDYYIPQLPKLKEDTNNISKWCGISVSVEKPIWEKTINENEGHFKCDRIVIKQNNMPTYAGVWSEEIIRSETNPDGIWTVDSGQRVKQCAYIGGASNQKLVYSFTNNRIEYSTSDTFDALTMILLSLDGGILHGVLAEYITQYIEQNYILHRYTLCNQRTMDEYIIPTVTKGIKNIPFNGITFGYFSDNHGRSDMVGYPNLTPKYLNQVDKLMNLDFILNAGDIIASADTFTLEQGLYSVTTQNREFDKPEKQIIAIGNHDQNGHTLHSEQEMSWTVTHKMFFDSCYRYLEKDKDVVWGSKEDLYFYKDFEDKRIRLIVLNSQDAGEETKTVDGVKYLKYNTLTTIGFRQEQLNWLAAVALDFSSKTNKSDWHTMVCCHVGIRRDITDNAPQFSNYEAVEAVIMAFKNGTSVSKNYTDTKNDGLFTVSVSADYTAQGAMPFIGVFSGHNHCDRIYTENYPQTTIMAGYPDKGYDSIDRTTETKNEFAFDVVAVDKDTRKVKFVRFGAGSDREYNY